MIRNKKAEFIMKDYFIIGMLFVLFFATVSILLVDMNKNEGIGDNVDISEIERYYNESYVLEMNKTTHSRLTNLQDAGFFRILFMTTLEIVEMIPQLVKMTVTSMGFILGLLLSGKDIIPPEIAMIISIMLFGSLMWAAVYFIRRLGK